MSSTESQLLDEIFGTNKYWRGRKVSWCDLCNVIVMQCKDCKGTTCNCMSCDKCSEDQKDFQALKPWPEAYMTEAEKEAVYKYHRIKQLLYTLFTESTHTLDEAGWEWLYRQGKLCDNDWRTFKLKFLPYDIAEMEGHTFYF